MKILIVCLLCLVSQATFSQKAKVHGVITYFFNDAQGDKPDLGAKVYAIDSAKCKGFSRDVEFNYTLKSISGQSGENEFDKADSLNALNNNKILESQDVITTTVDGAGNYSLELTPGTYYILIRSRGRNRISVSELSGKVYFHVERLTANQTIDASHNFALRF